MMTMRPITAGAWNPGQPEGTPLNEAVRPITAGARNPGQPEGTPQENLQAYGQVCQILRSEPRDLFEPTVIARDPRSGVSGSRLQVAGMLAKRGRRKGDWQLLLP